MYKHISSPSNIPPGLSREPSKSRGSGAALAASRQIVNSIISNITSTTDAQPTSGTYNTNCPCSGTLGGPGTVCSLCTVAVTFDPKTQSLEERYPSSLRPGLCYPGRDLELTPADRRVLCTLAVVSKAFSEPSLDVLWRTQTSLIPLVVSLSDDAYEVDDRGEVRIRRQVEYQDLVRVKHYSYRIKHLISPEPLSFTFCRGGNTSRTVWLSIDTAHSIMESFRSDVIFTKVHTLVIPSEVFIQLRPRLLFYVDALRSVTLITGTDSESADTNTESTQKATPSWYLGSLVLPLCRLKHFGIAPLHPDQPQPSQRSTKDKGTFANIKNTKPTQASSSEEGLTNLIRNFFPSPPQRPPSPDLNGRRLPPAPPAIQYAYHLTCLSFPNITIPTQSLFLLATTATATSPTISGIKSLDVRIRSGQLDEVLELWEIEHNDYPRIKYWEERGRGHGMHLFQGLEWLRLGVTTLGEPQRFIEKWSENKRVPLRALKIWRWGETKPSSKMARRDWDYTAFITTLYHHLSRGTLHHLSIIDETTIKSKALRIRSTFSPSLWHYLLQFHAITSFEICSPSLSLYLSTTPTASSTLASNIPPAPPVPQFTRPETEELQSQSPATHTFNCFCFTFHSKHLHSDHRFCSFWRPPPKEKKRIHELEWIPDDPRNLIPTLTPAILVRISHAWPNLTFFGWKSYDCVYESPPGGIVTLRELVDFVARCKCLRGLEVRFDARCGALPTDDKVAPESRQGFACGEDELQKSREKHWERKNSLMVSLPGDVQVPLVSGEFTAPPGVVSSPKRQGKYEDIAVFIAKLATGTKQKTRPPNPLPSSPYLEYLHVCTSPMGPGPEMSFGRGKGRRKDDSPWVIAALLRMAFPGLKRLEYGSPEEEEGGLRDDEGDEFLPVTESPASSRRRWTIVKELLSV